MFFAGIEKKCNKPYKLLRSMSNASKNVTFSLQYWYNNDSMNAEEITEYLTKFVTVILDDGSEVSGYISNPAEIRNARGDVDVVLVNGLQNSQIPLARVVGIHEAVREETTEIPIITEPSDLVSRMNKKNSAMLDDRLDELFDKSLSDTLEVKLPNGKIIDNSGK